MVQRLATEMYARGLSTRDIRFHRRSLPALSQQGLTEVLWEPMTSVTFRSCACFWTGSPLRTHGITRRHPDHPGRPEGLISLALGNKDERARHGSRFVSRLVDRRGLPTPLFITTDGAGGLIQAVDQMWSKSFAVAAGCMRNFARVPQSRWQDQTVSFRDAPDLEAGQKAVRESGHSKEFPGLCKCEDGRASGTPPAPLAAQEVRTTNLMRSFVEEQPKRCPDFLWEELPQTQSTLSSF